MDLFKLLGTIAIDTTDMDRAFKKAQKGGTETEEKLNSTFSKMGTAAVNFGKVVAAGVAAGATAVGGVVAKSVSAYADYEQLVGGVETLFGTGGQSVEEYAASIGSSVESIKKFQEENGLAVDGIVGKMTSAKIHEKYNSLMSAQSKVMENANNAYKTAGMSANEYMETVTSFSASLIASLGGDTEAAARYADQAITDMSDNANKMGTDIASLQTAYSGFAKQNYTMLDNLKLGYGGTKEEMERLIKDANKLRKAQGKAADLTIDSYADVVEAIHTVQTEMGITGTTAKEAEGTISGSIAMTKSAWENLMIGLGRDNADIPGLVSNVVSSGSKVLSNIIPVAKQVLKNIPAAISEISPEAGAAFQAIIDICIGAFDLLTSAIEPTWELISSIFQYLQENTWVLTEIGVVIGVIATAIGMYNAVAAVKAAMAAAEVTTVWGLVSAYVAQAAAMVAALAPYIAIAAAIAAVIAIGVALYKNWDVVKEKALELWGNLTATFSNIKEAVSQKIEDLKAAALEKWESIKNTVSQKASDLKDRATEKFEALKTSASEKWESMKETASEKWESMKTSASEKFESMKETMGTVMQAAKETVSEKLENMKSAYDEHGGGIKGVAAGAMEGVKGYYSAGYSFIDTLTGGKLSSVASKFKTKMEEAKNSVSEKLSTIKSSFSDKLSSAYDSVKDKFDSIKNKITEVMDAVKEKVEGAVEKLKSAFDFNWKLPDLKLPHISVSGGEAPYGIAGKGSLPKFNIEWYKRAYDNPVILDSPTIFGYSAATGKFLGGGEGQGSEVVAGTNTLMNMIASTVAMQNADIAMALYKILDAILSLDENMGGHMREALSGTSFEINKREFARLVKAVN